MNSLIISEKFEAYKLDLDRVLKNLEAISVSINNRQLQETINSLRKNINEPFSFVVVGEVKAGKSSFINALLKEKICQTAADPCTDVIQQIVYAEQPFEKIISPSLKKVGLPIEILQTISIVDTPGTNAIIENHQEITKKFIPNSDLVFFVFFAKNPYTRSAWELLDYVSAKWRKKVVFILQQSDLTKPEELRTNAERLISFAAEKGIVKPKIFATSAEFESQGKLQKSGFNKVRNYIKKTLGGDNSLKLKLDGVTNTTKEIINNLDSDIISLQEQLDIDLKVVNKIKNKLDRDKSQSQYELDSLIIRLLVSYDKITDRVKQDFRRKLSVITLVKSSFASLFSGDRAAPDWMDELKESCEAELKSSLGDISQDGLKHFVEGIRQLLQDSISDLQNIKEKRFDNNNISLQILERRQEVIEEVQNKVSGLLSDKSFLNSIESINASIAPNLLGGGAAALAGTFITTITRFILLDALGTAFAGVGLLFAGGSLWWKKRKIIHQFEEKLDTEKNRFQAELSSKLNSKLDIIYEEIERNFVGMYDYVAQEEAKLNPIIEDFHNIKVEANDVFNSIVEH